MQPSHGSFFMKLRGQCGQYDDESVYGSMRCREKRGELSGRAEIIQGIRKSGRMKEWPRLCM